LGWVGLGQSADGLGWIGSHKTDPWTTLVGAPVQKERALKMRLVRISASRLTITVFQHCSWLRFFDLFVNLWNQNGLYIIYIFMHHLSEFNTEYNAILQYTFKYSVSGG